ncbi:MAG: hypothetical protein ABEJ65_00500 [bacterium]
MSERLIDELREESEEIHDELKNNPKQWENYEEASDEFLPRKSVTW